MSKSSDAAVRARHVLAATRRVKHLGNDELLRQLEQREPELAEHVLEELTVIHGRIVGLGGPLRKSRRVYQQVVALLLVSLESLSVAHAELWSDESPASSDPAPGFPGDTPPSQG